MKELMQIVEFKPDSYEIKNLNQIKEYAEKTANKYKGIVVASEETYQTAKKQRAEVKKLREEVETARKKVKNDKLKELEVFEKDMKSISSIYNEAWEELENNIKDFEACERQEKEDLIQVLISNHGEGFEIEHNPKWTNRTFSEEQIAEEIKQQVKDIKEKIEKRKQELKVIEQAVLASGLEDTAGWIAMFDRGIDSQEILQRIFKAGEDKKNLVAQKENKIQEENINTNLHNQDLEIKNIKDEEPQEKIVEDIIKIRGTIKQFNNLNEYLVSTGMKVERYYPEKN
ncbi:DUF1351 domain-containing protein [Facklamia sp. P12955]|uniref:DUF1351 domain-containing protein n=1 Tax=Facklamia sp. P12955 TaxID=3421946 RepID=UPI003D183820